MIGRGGGISFTIYLFVDRLFISTIIHTQVLFIAIGHRLIVRLIYDQH